MYNHYVLGHTNGETLMVNNEGVPEVYQVHVHVHITYILKFMFFSPSGMLTPVNGLRLQFS